MKQTLEQRIRARFQKKDPLRKAAPKPTAEFPPGTLHADMSEPRFAKNADVFHGLDPNHDLMPPTDKGITHNIRFIGNERRKPLAVIKGPLDRKELMVNENMIDGPQTSYMLHPGFRTTHREAAYHALADKVFGLADMVPRTAVFRHPVTQEPWSAQQFVPHAEKLTNPTSQLHHYAAGDKLHRAAIMDSILAHNDRHGGNALVDRYGGLHLIDNAGAFDYMHRFATWMPRYAQHIMHTEVPAATHRWLNRIDDRTLADELSRAGAPLDVTHMALKRLAEAKRWSKLQHGNPAATKELAGALQVIQTHRFGDPDFLAEARKLTYERIARGEQIAHRPGVDPDKTQFRPEDKTWKKNTQ